MAASDARPVPRYGTAFRVYFALRYLDGRLDTGWVNPSGFISKDGGVFANVTSNPVEVGSRGCGYCDLTATEMTADGVTLILQDTKAILGSLPNSGIPLVLTFYPEQDGDYKVNVVQMSGLYVSPATTVDANIVSISGVRTHLAEFNRPLSGTVNNLTNMPSGAIAQAVWDRQVSTSISTGTFGNALNQASGILLSRLIGTILTGSHNPQTGDSFARIGVNGAGLTAIPTIANVTTVANITNFPSGAIADAVWDENLLSHLASDSAGDWLYISATRNVDPWDEDLTTYGAGTAAYQIYSALNATSGAVLNGTIDTNIISVNGVPVDTSATIDANIVQVSGVNVTLADFNTGGTGGATAADVWSYATRQLTSFPSGAFAEAVWNEQVTGNLYAGTFGNALSIASGILLQQGATGAGLTAIPTIANVSNLINFPSGAVADAVWDEQINTHQVFGTAGRALMTASGDSKLAVGAITTTTFTTGAIDANAIATNAIGSAEFSQAAADKVWASTVSGKTTAGTFGDAVNQASGVSLRQGATGTGLSAIPTIAAVTTVTNLTNAPTAGDFTATMKTSIGTAVWTTPATRTITGGTVDNLTNLASGAIADAVWDEVVSQHQTFGTAGHTIAAASGNVFIGSHASPTNITAGTITNLTNFPSGAVADAVWDEVLGQHQVIGTTGYALNTASGNLIGGSTLTAAQVWTYSDRQLTSFPSGSFADAIWDEVLGQHQVIGTAGYALNVASGNLIGGTGTVGSLSGVVDANIVSISGVKVNIDSSSVADSEELNTLGDLLLRRARIIRLVP